MDEEGRNCFVSVHYERRIRLKTTRKSVLAADMEGEQIIMKDNSLFFFSLGEWALMNSKKNKKI